MINDKNPLTRLVFTLLLLISVSASALDKVSLQLLWLHQFEFAGFYVAKEKGFYRDVGLEVEINQHRIGINVVDEVVKDNGNYGVGRIALLKDRSEGHPVVLLKSIFQVSPLVLLGKKSEKLTNIQDIKNKRIMHDPSTAESLAFRAMLSANNIDFDNDVSHVKHTLDINSLVNDDTDLISAYVYNEPYHLLQLGIEPIYFSPSDYGFEFYADILFTSEDEFKNHPERVEKFINASIKGWLYAFANINEAAKLIYDKYNSQNKTLDALVYEGEKLKPMALYKNRPFGDISIDRLKTTYDIYRSIGLVNQDLHYQDFVYEDPKTTLQIVKDFVKQHIDNGNLLFFVVALLSIILTVVLWNLILKKKVAIAVEQKLESERLIFRQNRIKEMAMMMSGVSHQWRQPLANIGATVINIDAIYQNNKLDKATLDEKLDNIENSLHFMSTTIDDFSNYLNANTEQAQFSINECIAIAIKLLSAEFLKYNINVRCDTQNEVLYVGRKNELLQVLVIILNNAKDALIHQVDKKNISLTIEQTDVVKINIADNGCGIDKAHLNKIFEPNFSTHSNHLDNGLGLYIAQTIIKSRFNGNISVVSEQGAIFTLVLRGYECGGGR